MADLVTRLEGALLHVEGRLADLGNGTRGGDIPHAWFVYNDLARKLRPLVHAAAEAQRYDSGPQASCPHFIDGEPGMRCSLPDHHEGPHEYGPQAFDARDKARGQRDEREEVEVRVFDGPNVLLTGIVVETMRAATEAQLGEDFAEAAFIWNEGLDNRDVKQMQRFLYRLRGAVAYTETLISLAPPVDEDEDE